ncbi:hypothetical protein GS934_18270 [Rhodococcus hoagii]|nr:hypothetical protein [Prescottella equi]NKZ88267.1 hypothetical protein [Prescottella equi]
MTCSALRSRPRRRLLRRRWQLLLATQVAGRLTSTTGVEIGVRDVFDAATAADLARTIETRGARPVGSSELRASTTPLDAGPLSPAQRRLWFQHLLDPASDVYKPGLHAALRVTW